MRPVPQDESVSDTADTVSVDIVAENVDNLGAFVFVLVFDQEVLRATEVRRGDFLASTGREPLCDEATIDPTAVRLQCVTLRPTPEGPDGTGVLATVVFEPVDEGTSTLRFSRAQMARATAGAGSIEIETYEATLTVSGDGTSWLPFAIGGAVAAGILVAVAAGGALWLRRRPHPAAPEDARPAA